jgi:flagellar protein FlbD
MITLNRLGHNDEPFHLNIDMIVTVESTPDTVITLATGVKVVVAETPEEVAAAVHAYRAAVLGDALRRRSRAGVAGLQVPPTPLQAPLTPPQREPPRLSAVEDEPV